MPKFRITDSETGDELTITADREPSQDDVAEIFASRPKAKEEPKKAEAPNYHEVTLSSPIGVPMTVRLPIDPMESLVTLPTPTIPKQEGNVTLSSPIGVPFEIPKQLATEAGAAIYNVAKPAVEFPFSPAGTVAAGMPESALGKSILQGLFAGLAAKSGGEALGEASVTGETQKGLEGALMLGTAPLLAKPGTRVKPAVRTMDGKVVEGKAGETHNQIIENNAISAKNVDRREFTVEQPGQPKVEASREQIAQVVPTEKPGEAHSTDLPEAKSKVELLREEGLSENTARDLANGKITVEQAVDETLPQIVKPKAGQGHDEAYQEARDQAKQRLTDIIKPEEPAKPPPSEAGKAPVASVLGRHEFEDGTAAEVVTVPAPKSITPPEGAKGDVIYQITKEVGKPGVRTYWKPEDVERRLRKYASERGGFKESPLSQSAKSPVAEPKGTEATTPPPTAVAGEEGIAPGTVTAAPGTASQSAAPAGAEAAIRETKPGAGEAQAGAAKPIGMGGAVPAEFERSPETATGIKNATVDKERVKRGLPPAMQPARRSFGEVWDRAMGIVDRDPAKQDALINELNEKPRALTDTEDALLLQRQIDLQNEYGKATRDLAQAFDDGRMDQVAELKQRVAEWSDKLQQLYDITKTSGTETGRGLNARKMMAYEDMTLAKMETETRAAKGGARLTDAERAHLADLEKRFKDAEKAHDDYVKQAQTRIVELESRAKMAELAAAAKTEPKFPEVILRTAERIVSTLDTRADAARIRLRAKMGRTTAGVDPTILFDLTEIGASHIGHLGLDFAKWSAKMIEDVGDWVKPHLDEVFKASQGVIDRFEVGERVKQAVKKLTPEEAKKDITAKVTELFAKNEKSKLAYYFQKLAKIYYGEGVTERDAMVNKLTEFAQQVDPKITRDEVARIWSGYGEYKQLSKDQITVALRGMKGELQQIAKLEDMAKGEPPLKSGLERRTPTEAERQLVKLVNDAKYKFQIPVQDPTTQLKSALDTLKTTLRNRITDYEDRIARKDFSARPRREIILDREAQRLKADAERVRVRYQWELERYRLSQRNKYQKLADAFVKWERAFKLSSPVVFGKLGAAALTRLATTATEEAAGAGLSKAPVISKIAAQASREGYRSPEHMAQAIDVVRRMKNPNYIGTTRPEGANVRAMARALAEAWDVGMRDAAQTAKSGMTDLDIILGKKGGVDPDWVNVFGQLHGMMKAPIKRAEYTLSLEKRLAHEIARGNDVSDPVLQMRVMTEALNDGYRSIFMQRGFTGDMFNTLVRTMEQSKRYPNTGFITAKAMRFLFPIVRVPINIVGETATGVAGVPIASARTMFHAMNKGLENLDPKTADAIMRQFKKGSIGAGLMAIGYFNAQNIGGYDWREKRKPGEVKTGGFQIFDKNVPRWMTHAPWFELMQFGATVRRVSDQHVKGKEKGFSEGAWAAGLGLLDETPFYGELMRASRGFETASGRRNFGGQLLRSTVVPQAFSTVATMTDTAEKRKPETYLEHVMMGIPGLRQQVGNNTVLPTSY